jgi:hypothetical protein
MVTYGVYIRFWPTLTTIAVCSAAQLPVVQTHTHYYFTHTLLFHTHYYFTHTTIAVCSAAQHHVVHTHTIISHTHTIIAVCSAAQQSVAAGMLPFCNILGTDDPHTIVCIHTQF